MFSCGKITVRSGVRVEDGKFVFDFSRDLKGDIINLAEISLQESSIFNHTYLYGYEFCEDVPSIVRTEFIKQIKGLKGGIGEKQLKIFLIRPIDKFNEYLNFFALSCIIYPTSQRTEINRTIVRYINDYSLLGSRDFVPLELVKKANCDIEFDFAGFRRDKGDHPRYEKWKREAEKLVQKINNSDEYFTISSLPTYYRKYIFDYLEFVDKDTERLVSLIDGKEVLIVDDINTTQATLTEILRVIYRVAVPKRLIVFTVLGKDYSNILE
jgi:hypothetical protein